MLYTHIHDFSKAVDGLEEHTIHVQSDPVETYEFPGDVAQQSVAKRDYPLSLLRLGDSDNFHC